MDSRLQNFWVESINKEESVRFTWHLKYSKKFAKEAAASSNKKQAGPAVAKMKLNSSLSKRIEKMEKEKELLSPGTQTGSTDKKATTDDSQSPPAVIMRDMRPPSSKTRSLLYNGLGAHGEGRYAYLSKRKFKSPVEKYEFPVLSSCLYGWKIMEHGVPKSSPFGRTFVIKDTFYRPSGIIIGTN